jgi:hypothetical protein
MSRFFILAIKIVILAVLPSILPIRIKLHKMQADFKTLGSIGAIPGWAQGHFVAGADIDTFVDIDVDQGHDCPERTGIQST